MPLLLLTYTFCRPNTVSFLIYMQLFLLPYSFTYGMETTYFYFGKQQNEKKIFDNTFSMMLLSTVIFSSAIILFRNPIQHLFKIEFAAHYIIMMAALLFRYDKCNTFCTFAQHRQSPKIVYIKLTGNYHYRTTYICFYQVIPGWYQSSNSMLHNFSALIYSPPLTVSVVLLPTL
ncbi:MAG: hypothetical protein IPP29_07600 [Bacteroidetes bacterium]|nr:hypothetical protein [Bacteroidota bacterium]